MTAKTKKKLSLKEKIRRGPATEVVPMWVGADMTLVREYETAQAALEAETDDEDSLAGPAATKPEFTDRMREIQEELADYLIEFRVRAVDPKRWNKLLEKHPPRVDDEGKADPRDRAGWNMETFPPALIRAATVSPELDEDDWRVLLGDEVNEATLTGGQIDQLSAAVLRLSQFHINIPFARAASPTTPSSVGE
jgi:hypothetical protein